MFSKKQSASPDAGIRRLLHDLRASQHAARLNAEAAMLLARQAGGNTGNQLRRHLELMQKELDKCSRQLEELSQRLTK